VVPYIVMAILLGPTFLLGDLAGEFELKFENFIGEVSSSESSAILRCFFGLGLLAFFFDGDSGSSSSLSNSPFSSSSSLKLI
jgi:hypothetical protein